MGFPSVHLYTKLHRVKRLKSNWKKMAQKEEQNFQPFHIVRGINTRVQDHLAGALGSILSPLSGPLGSCPQGRRGPELT